MKPMRRWVCLWAAAAAVAGAARAVDLEYRRFTDPPVAFWSMPFWSWNDRLEPEEIARQLAAFKEGGYGGGYFHSRAGLLTEYLGPDWWRAVDAGVDACRKLGLEAWFYDEDRWPSGFAGGAVPKQGDAFHARILYRLAKTEPVPDGGEVLAEDGQYRYVCMKAKMGDPRFNGTCWVDLLNPETVRAFIESTYKPYAERYAKDIGKTAPGIFTDEPQIAARFPPAITPNHKGLIGFSPAVRDLFRKEHGYDVMDHAAGLFEDAGDFRKVRLDYFRTLSRAFEQSFTRAIGEHCGKTGMAFTGHFMGEDNFETVMQYTGNTMIQYRHMQRPGMDFLGLRIANGLNTARSLSSVANQHGLERRLSELFGTSGQNMNFEDRKWIGDWHAVLGVNHFCPHLALYTMKGCRKRDYPPTISPQQPYWSFNSRVEAYMARVCYMTTCGTYAPEFLVIHPLESAYAERAWGEGQNRSERYANFNRVLEILQQNHRDYDLGDEQILAETGRTEGNTLIVGKMRYKAVLLPVMSTIRGSTVDLLRRFYDAGGAILVVGEFPKFIDGKTDASVLPEASRTLPVISMENLPGELLRAIQPAVRIDGTNAESVWVHRRTEGNGQIIQLANTSRLAAADVALRLAGNADMPVVWDPADGICLGLNPNADGSYSLRLAEAQTLIITTGDPSRKAVLSGTYGIPRASSPVLRLAGPWRGKRKDPNAVTLDFACYSTDGGSSFSAFEPVIGIHERLASKNYNGPLRLRYEVRIGSVPQECALVVEQPGMFKTMSVNEVPFEFKDQGYFVDRTFRKSAITRLLRTGVNAIDMALDYRAPVPGSANAVERYGTEIESMYLIGRFGVEAETSPEMPAPSQRNESKALVPRPVYRFRSFRLIDEKSEFRGNLALERYPFYAGRFELECTFDLASVDKTRSYFLTFPAAEAVVIEGKLNGKTLDTVLWSPWEMDVTRALKPGRNTLKLTLTNSLRNLLGPHHHRDGELIRTSPGSFSGGEPNWYDLRRTGTTKIWRDDYHHIAFGFLEPPVVVIR